MSISIYDSDSKGTIKEQLAAWEEAAAKTQAKIASLRVMAERFPDAEDRGPYNNPRWWSRSAHEVADRIDGNMLGNWSRFCRGCLYVEIDGARVYSSRPVDLVAAFDEYAKKGGDLLAILKGTTRAAEAALNEHETKEKALEEKLAKEREDARRLAAEEKAQPVRIVGEVSVKAP